MYKQLGLIFLLVLLFFYSPDYTLCDTALDYNGTFHIYTYQNFTSNNITTIKNGNGYILTMDNENAKNIYRNLDKNKVTGFSFETTGNDNDIKNLLQKLHSTIIFIEKIDEITFIYAYSPIFDELITYNNKKINIQISKNEQNIQIGVPLILGSA